MQNEVICKQREKTIPFGQKLTIITFVHSDNNFRKYMLRKEHAECKYNIIKTEHGKKMKWHSGRIIFPVSPFCFIWKKKEISESNEIRRKLMDIQFSSLLILRPFNYLVE